MGEALDLPALENCVRIAEMHRGPSDPSVMIAYNAIKRLYGSAEAAPPSAGRSNALDEIKRVDNVIRRLVEVSGFTGQERAIQSAVREIVTGAPEPTTEDPQ